MRGSVSLIVYTRDRHPPDHCSFTDAGGPWPPHCVDGTPGFAFHPRLTIAAGALIIDKAITRDRDSYSSFAGTSLAHELRSRGIRRCLVGGLATDYCVQATVLDALGEGFETWVLTDAIAAVDLHPGDEERAILAMRTAGARLSDTEQIQTVLRSHPRPTALLIVDVQNDFCPGGALPVTRAERVIAPLNALLDAIGS